MESIIDASVDLTRHAGALAEAGVQTVIRYYSRSEWKRMDRAEADALIAAGLSIATVFQQRGGAGGHIEDLDAESGTRDAGDALAQAGACGQPTGSAIYFAVDHDFHAPDDLASILDYFEAVRGVIGDLYRVGCYGSGRVQEYARAALRWLPNASAWQGTKAAIEAGQYDLLQRRQQQSPWGFPYDPNEARVADFGQWPVSAGKPEPKPSRTREQVRSVQRACEAAGIPPGPIDGIVGPLTRAAVAKLRVLIEII